MDDNILEGAVQHDGISQLRGLWSGGRRSAVEIDRGGETILCRRRSHRGLHCKSVQHFLSYLCYTTCSMIFWAIYVHVMCSAIHSYRIPRYPNSKQTIKL